MEGPATRLFQAPDLAQDSPGCRQRERRNSGCGTDRSRCPRRQSGPADAGGGGTPSGQCSGRRELRPPGSLSGPSGAQSGGSDSHSSSAGCAHLAARQQKRAPSSPGREFALYSSARPPRLEAAVGVSSSLPGEDSGFSVENDLWSLAERPVAGDPADSGSHSLPGIE